MSLNKREAELSALTRQKEQLLRVKKNYSKDSKDYRMIDAVIKEHDKEIKKRLGG